MSRWINARRIRFGIVLEERPMLRISLSVGEEWWGKREVPRAARAPAGTAARPASGLSWASTQPRGGRPERVCIAAGASW